MTTLLSSRRKYVQSIRLNTINNQVCSLLLLCSEALLKIRNQLLTELGHSRDYWKCKIN